MMKIQNAVAKEINTNYNPVNYPRLYDSTSPFIETIAYFH